MFDMIGSYDEAWKAIISPARQDYNISDLGPAEFAVRDNRIKRTDFRLLNNRGHVLECSFFEHVNIQTPVPCVIYLHGNGCSRMEAINYLDTVLSQPVSFFCFDFSGCGKSEGLYTSIGWHEQDDLDCIIQYLYNSQKVSRIAVWGRSMGAITALFYAKKDPRVKCFIFDSPFSNFKQMIKELVKAKAPIPEFLVSGALKMIRKTVLKKADFDIDVLKPAKFVDQIKMPALFGAAREDALVSAQHTRDLFNAYGGLKELLIFEGDHNSRRPDAWKSKVQEFIRIHLLETVEDPNRLKSFKLYFASQQNPEESMSINLEKDNASPIRSHYLPKPLKQVPTSSQDGMNFSWLKHSNSVSTRSSDFTTPQKENVTDQKRAYFPMGDPKDMTLNSTPKSANITSESAPNNGGHYRRAATSYINVRESYEASKLAAKDCLSPPDFHRVVKHGLETSGSLSINVNDTDSLRYSGARSEDLMESPNRVSSYKHSATLKDISSFGLNGSSGIMSAGLDSSKSVSVADLKTLTPKSLISDSQFPTSPEFVKSPDFKRVSSGSYASYQPAGPQEQKTFHKKNVSNITHSIGTRTSLAEDSSPAVKLGHHTQKKSVMLKVKVSLDTPIISATAQTARTSMADFLARNLCQEESVGTIGRESAQFTSKSGSDVVRMKC